MTYDTLEQQIKSLPHEYYIQVENFVHFMVAQVEKQSQKKDTSNISAKLKAVYAKIPAIEQIDSCAVTLDSWRALTQTDTW